jgi:hypothetical protein
MAFMGYRPQVPADPAARLRPSALLAPARSPARALRVPASYRRRSARFRTVAAADVVSVLGALAVALASDRALGIWKAVYVAAFAGVGAVGIALACVSLERTTLRLRGFSGWFLGIPLAATCARVASAEPRLAVAFAAAGLWQVLGGLIVREAATAADAEASLSRTRAALADPPAPAAAPADAPLGDAPAAPVREATRRGVRALRVATLGGGLAWLLGGLVETLRGNWWLGILVTGFGVLAVRLAGEVGWTRTDARVRASDRTNPWAWAFVPVGALAVGARAAWLLGWI